MIELDDTITNINLGVDEYTALKALDVQTIRHLLLLDADKVLSLIGYRQVTSMGISIWQKLLRKYLTYEKLHESRQKGDVPEEELKIHDPATKLDLEEGDLEILQNLGIQTVLDFLEAELGEMLTQKGYEQPIHDRLLSLQDRLSIIELLEESPLEESLLTEPTIRTPARFVEPEKTVSIEEFLDEPVSEAGFNPGELEVLEALHVEKVRDFLELNVNRVLDLKGYSERVFLRISSWQKYLRKRLHWKK